MNKREEARLAATAKEAQALRKTIDNADSMIRSWARHKCSIGSQPGTVYLSLSDRRHSSWHCGVELPAAVVERDLITILKRIRSEATAQLAELDLPQPEARAK